MTDNERESKKEPELKRCDYSDEQGKKQQARALGNTLNNSDEKRRKEHEKERENGLKFIVMSSRTGRM